MRLALLADIHGNYAALKACLDAIDAGRVDGIVFLGDYVSDCPYPQRTMELIREKTKPYRTWYIRGNREDYLIHHHRRPDDGWTYSSGSGSLLYTYDNLSSEDISFFEKMPISMTIAMEGFSPITVCHGSPGNSREPLYAHTQAADDCLRRLRTDSLFCAHTHRSFRYAAFGKTLVGCASVGAPVNGQTNAQFVLLTGENGIWKDQLVSVPYPVGEILRAFEDSGLKKKAGVWARAVMKLLQTGENYPEKCLKLAIQKAEKENGAADCCGPTEAHWLKAAEELRIL